MEFFLFEIFLNHAKNFVKKFKNFEKLAGNDHYPDYLYGLIFVEKLTFFFLLLHKLFLVPL